MKNLGVWLKGLAAALIGGAFSSAARLTLVTFDAKIPPWADVNRLLLSERR